MEIAQGSPFSALLFAIYINPVFNLNIQSSILGYADDFKLFNNNKVELENDFVLVADWLCSNNLKVNINKTAFMIFSICNTKTASTINCLGNVIQSVDHHKDLGIIIDPALTYKRHIQFLINNTIHQEFAFTKRFLRDLSNNHAFYIWFFAMFISIISYGITIYSSVSFSHLEKLI